MKNPEYENASDNPDGTKNMLVCGRMYYGVDEDGDQTEIEDDSWQSEG